MTFAVKIDALMSAYNVSNADLAKVIYTDRSTISRYRNGSRGIPTPPVVKKIADGFSLLPVLPHQMDLLATLVGDTRLQSFIQAELLSDILYKWLISSSGIEKSRISRKATANNIKPHDEGKNSELCTFKGSLGKRQATVAFFTELNKMDTPCTVKLVSDEDAEWILEDEKYTAQIAMLLKELATKGFRFLRIQPPPTRLESSLCSIRRWLDVYMLGAIVQYYYPYARDQLYRRTLMVADNLALCSSTVAGQRENYLTLLTADGDFVQTLDSEFDIILGRCRQTMNIYSADEAKRIYDIMISAAAIQADGIYKSGYLSFTTLPEQVIERIGNDGTNIGFMMVKAYHSRKKLRRAVLTNHNIVDIMYLPSVAEVKDGLIPIPGSWILPNGMSYYTLEDYRMHIENILRCIKEYPRYSVVLTRQPMWTDMLIYCKENSNTVMVKDSEPRLVFEVTETGLSDSFWVFFKQLQDSSNDFINGYRVEEALNNMLLQISNTVRA